MAKGDIREVADWLIDGARSATQPQDVVVQLCDRLVASGLPLWRVGVFVRTLHPQIRARRLVWRQGHGVEVGEASWALFDTDEFRDSPVQRVHQTGAPLRRRLADPDCPLDLSTLSELRAEGVTDYLVSPLVFTDGDIHVATWSTRRAGGFSAAHIAAIETIVKPLTRIAEARAMRRTAANLLDTYVGNRAGERILLGHIRRGDTEAIDAAIWFSDMRGSTRLAERLGPQAFIDLLNRYFDCQVPTIAAHGGEVLKFMGDGLLAIFPVAGDEPPIGEVCRQALDAARCARANVAALAGSTAIAGVDRLGFGVALHIGRVQYGNIGSGNRLDFTCIGSAMNLAARIETLARELQQTILASSAFAEECGPQLEPIGAFRLPGITAEQTVYRPAD